MAISNVTKYLKFASAQMAAESLFSGESANPAEIDVGKKIIDLQHQQHQGSNCFARCRHE